MCAAKIREERGYSYHDIINVNPDKLPDYEARIKIFFQEHLHTDDETRCARAAAASPVVLLTVFRSVVQPRALRFAGTALMAPATSMCVT